MFKRLLTIVDVVNSVYVRNNDQLSVRCCVSSRWKSTYELTYKLLFSIGFRRRKFVPGKLKEEKKIKKWQLENEEADYYLSTKFPQSKYLISSVITIFLIQTFK
jgi:hypothetical protein